MQKLTFCLLIIIFLLSKQLEEKLLVLIIHLTESKLFENVQT